MRALLLDFGGVVSLTLFETLGDVERSFGLAPGTLGWTGPFDPGRDPLWRRSQAGEITERDYWHTRAAQIGEHTGEAPTIQDLLRRSRSHDLPSIVRPEASALIADARREGLGVGILSNELELFYGRDAVATLVRALGIDCVVDATTTGILKPDPRAYRLGCEALGIEPGDTVFVDDQPTNVTGALAAGLHAVHLDVTRPGSSFDAARDLLQLKDRAHARHL